MFREYLEFARKSKSGFYNDIKLEYGLFSIGSWKMCEFFSIRDFI